MAQSLGYAVTLASDAHSTFDSPVLAAPKIIEHHNRLLGGIVERVIPSVEIALASGAGRRVTGRSSIGSSGL